LNNKHEIGDLVYSDAAQMVGVIKRIFFAFDTLAYVVEWFGDRQHAPNNMFSEPQITEMKQDLENVNAQSR
jgi:hypothetical protein